MQLLAEFAEAWWPLYAVHLLETGVFLSLIWVLDHWLPLSLRMRSFLWLLGLVKLFVPPVMSLPAPVVEAPIGQALLLPVYFQPFAANSPETLTLPAQLFLLWLASVIVITALMLWQDLGLRRRLSGAIRYQPDARRILSGALTDLPLRIFTSDRIHAPVLLGIFRPNLYLPADFPEWPPARQDSVLAHEMAHFRNKDLFKLALQNLALALFAANPLVWLLHRRLLEVQELRCDAEAIDRSGVSAVEYSKILYHFLEKQNKQGRSVMAGNYFAESRRSLLRRFKQVLHLPEAQEHKGRGWHAVVLVLVAAAIVPFSWQCSKEFMQKQAPTAVEEPKEETSIFTEFDTPPTPVGGFAAIQKNLHYPEIARKAGIEGRVILNVLISETGEVLDVKVLKQPEQGQHAGLPESAINAVKGVKWEPATKDGKPLKVWVGIPVIFKLNANAEPKEGKFLEIPPPPPPPEGRLFVAFDTPPEPIGGFKTIQEKLEYPAAARAGGFEGQVIVNVLVSEAGEVLDCKIVKSAGRDDMDAAAIAAVKATAWTPAKQKDTPVKVWVAIPVIFKLEGGSSQEEQRTWSPPPPPPQLEKRLPDGYKSFDYPPVPEGGWHSLQSRLQYPDAARKAGMQGKVYIALLISARGEVEDAFIQASSGHAELDAAALATARDLRWNPAKKDGQPTGSWAIVPFVFAL